MTGPWQNLLEEWHDEEILSIVIVRHPLSRLASVYYQKFVELSTHKSWAKEGLNKTNKQTKIFPQTIEKLSWGLVQLISAVIARYREKGEEGPTDLATPTEFLRWDANTSGKVLLSASHELHLK